MLPRNGSTDTGARTAVCGTLRFSLTSGFVYRNAHFWINRSGAVRMRSQEEKTRAVNRERAALSRSELSRPMGLALSDGIISEATHVFDYGCGKGDDLRLLRDRSIPCLQL